MHRSDRTVMNAKPPSVKQVCHPMNTRHNNMSRIFAIRDICDSMIVAHTLYTVISRYKAPEIRISASLLHVIPDESSKAWCRQIRNCCHTNSTRTTPTHFRRYGNECLSFRTSPTNLLPDSPDVGFIYFDFSGQLIPSGAHHRPTQFMKPGPGRIITAKTKDPFQSESTGFMFLTRHKPHSQKPCPKWFVTPMKQSSRRTECLPFTFSAKEKTTPHYGRLVSLFGTARANKALRPSKFSNIFKASIFAAKPFIKVLDCSRIINAQNGVPWLFHDHILHLVVG